MPLPKCQCQPDLDSVLRKARVNEIGKLLTYFYEAFKYTVIFCSLERPNLVYSAKFQSSMPFFCSCHIISLFHLLLFYCLLLQKNDLNSLDISAKLSMFCAFMLNVEICFQCFDSVG